MGSPGERFHRWVPSSELSRRAVPISAEGLQGSLKKKKRKKKGKERITSSSQQNLVKSMVSLFLFCPHVRMHTRLPFYQRSPPE